MSAPFGLYLGGENIDLESKRTQYLSTLDNIESGDVFSMSNIRTTGETIIRSIAVNDGQLYVAGGIYLGILDKTNTLGPNIIATNIPGQDKGINIYTLTTLDDELYIGGSTTEGKMYLAKLDKNTNKLGNNLFTQNIDGKIEVMTTFNENLYIGGYTQLRDGGTAGYPNISIQKYNKQKIIDLTLSAPDFVGNKGHIYGMTIYNNKLYFSGNIAAEGNSYYEPLIIGLSSEDKFGNMLKDPSSYKPEGVGTDPKFYDMIEYNGKLYAVGHMIVIDANTSTGTDIVKPTQYVSTVNPEATNLNDVYGPNLIQGGKKGQILSVSVHNNDLYVAGNLYIGGSGTLYIGKLNRNKIEPIDIKLNNALVKGTIYTTIDFNKDMIHGDDSGTKVNKTKKMALILGLSLGLGIPVLGVIIFLMYKYIPRKNN